jgi:hypothetical protein
LNEGAENGLAAITAVASPGYSVISPDAKVSGGFSFHLAHPQPPEDQLLILNRSIRPRSDSQLSFFARLGWATSNQVAKAQISSDGGKSWQDVWTKAGSGGRGDTTFTRQSVSLASFAGTEILIRFAYDYEFGGVYFKDAANGVGFYIDDISVSNAEELIDRVVSDVSGGTSFTFMPTTVADYSLRVRSKVSDRFLGYGPAKLVSAQTGVPAQVNVRITDAQLLGADQIQVNFELTSGASANLKLESAPSPAGPWMADASASVQPAQAPTTFRAITATVGINQRYYRISAN